VIDFSGMRINETRLLMPYSVQIGIAKSAIWFGL